MKKILLLIISIFLINIVSIESSKIPKKLTQKQNNQQQKQNQDIIDEKEFAEALIDIVDEENEIPQKERDNIQKYFQEKAQQNGNIQETVEQIVQDITQSNGSNLEELHQIIHTTADDDKQQNKKDDNDDNDIQLNQYQDIQDTIHNLLNKSKGGQQDEEEITKKLKTYIKGNLKSNIQQDELLDLVSRAKDLENDVTQLTFDLCDCKKDVNDLKNKLQELIDENPSDFYDQVYDLQKQIIEEINYLKKDIK